MYTIVCILDCIRLSLESTSFSYFRIFVASSSSETVQAQFIINQHYRAASAQCFRFVQVESVVCDNVIS
jgi:hypothetical protein